MITSQEYPINYFLKNIVLVDNDIFSKKSSMNNFILLAESNTKHKIDLVDDIVKNAVEIYINKYTSPYIEKEIIKLCTKNSVTHFYKSYVINNLKGIPPEQIEHYLEQSSVFRKSIIQRSEDIYIFNNLLSILYDMWVFFRDECFRKFGN